MARHNLPRKARKDNQWRTAYVRIPEYPYIYVFKIKSMKVKCINTCAYYFATSESDVYDHDHPLIDRLIAQI